MAAADAAFAAEVATLRRDARQRARSRPVAHFSGEAKDQLCAGVAARWYSPASCAQRHAVVFLHGGYGIFGDLDLQDAWCRELADGWHSTVVSVDYPLAPEHTVTESVDAVIRVIRAVGRRILISTTSPSLVLAGDSAGAALALAVAVTMASEGEHPLGGLLLTNPNVDLTLRRFDERATDGPDRELSRRSFARWAYGWAHSLDFVDHVEDLPPTFVAVGMRDAVRGGARALAEALAAVETDVGLVELDSGHGFLGDEALRKETVRRSRDFFER